MKKYLLFIAFTLVVFFNKAICQAWPIAQQDQQHLMVGTIGEDRGGQMRYHKGVDVPAPAQTTVYAIEGGTYNRVGSNAVCVGHYCYVHVTNFQFDEDDPVVAGQKIATVETIAHPHVHVQLSANNTVDITDTQGDHNWLNPLHMISPFIDAVQPDIDDVSRVQQRFVPL